MQAQFLKNELKCLRDVVPGRGIREPQNVPSLRRQKTVARNIVTFSIGMQRTVKFDDNPALDAGEIRDVPAYQILSLKFEPTEPAIAKLSPKHFLVLDGFVSHLARTRQIERPRRTRLQCSFCDHPPHPTLSP